ncbi:autotransporter outer membrane beta-barrel domain-containing protein [Burkholderia sp. JPY481]
MKRCPRRANHRKLRLAAVAVALACGEMSVPRIGFAQSALNIDGNTTVTAPAGPSSFTNVVAGASSGNNGGGAPGGTFIVPTGANVVLSGIQIGQFAGSTGLITVNGGSINTTNPESQYYIGFEGSGTLTVSDGGSVHSLFISRLGERAGSAGVLTVEGHGSTYTNDGQFIVGNGGTGQINVLNGGSVSTGTSLQIGGSTTATALVSGPGSTLRSTTSLSVGIGTAGALTVTDGGMASSGTTIYLAFNPGASGTVTASNGGLMSSPNLVIAQGGTADMRVQSNGTVTVGGNAIIGASAGAVGNATVTDPGSVLSAATLAVGQSGTGNLTIENGAQVSANAVSVAQNAGSTGTLNIGAPTGSAPVAPGTLVANTLTFGAGTGNVVFNHTDNSGSYTFPAAIAGTGTVNVLNGETVMTGASTYAGPTMIEGGTLAAGATQVFSANSDYHIASAGKMGLRGFDQRVASVVNAGLIHTAGDPGTTLTTTQYVGNNGTIALDTFLGADNSPSDRLVIDTGTATGASKLAIRNAGGPGALTRADGIPVVIVTNGGTTNGDAFSLAGEARGGAFTYDLFRGGVNGSNLEDWFLRSHFVVPPTPEEPIPPVVPPVPPVQPEVVPPDPPAVGPLPPGTYPIIGPELATYGVMQPIARQIGLEMLGTLHERIGDTLTPQAGGADRSGLASSAWGRVFGSQIDNRYQAFANPRANGSVIGVQTGLDVWRGSFWPGHRDIAGVYFAYGHGSADVDGIMTNAAATEYIFGRTGSMNLNAYSGAGYWTHYGPSGWYLDAVLQGTHYDGDASTQSASLSVQGSGFVTSLEAGYPIPLALGPGFVIEPQAQIIWQHVSFSDTNDSLGSVSLGSTSGATGRLGVRGQWTIEGGNHVVWQPYVRANLWRDWNAQATTTFGGDQVPLIIQATRLEFAGGVTAKITGRLNLYAQFGYQLAVSGDSNVRRNGVKGDFGVRYSW